MVELSESMWNLALEPLRTYLHYSSAYDPQTWKDGDLPYGTPTDKVM